MLVVWVSGLAVSRRLDKGIQKGGGNKNIKKYIKIKASKQTKTTKQRQTNKDASKPSNFKSNDTEQYNIT